MRAVRHLTLVPLATLLSVGAPAEATHDVTHRYVVLGYVRDAARRPIAGRAVEVVRERTGAPYPLRPTPRASTLWSSTCTTRIFWTPCESRQGR